MIAAIDNSLVPGPDGAGYGFDSYDGKTVGMGIFDNLAEISILFASIRAMLETGARRGTGYLGGGPNRNIVTKLLKYELKLESIKSL